MSMRYLTRKLFGRYNTTKRSSERPPIAFVQQIPQNLGLQPSNLATKARSRSRTRSRSKTPLFAKDTNSPHWPRIYEKAIKRGNPSIGEESLKQQVAQQVRLRKELRARKQAKQTATKYRGKKSRRKSRSLLSIFY